MRIVQLTELINRVTGTFVAQGADERHDYNSYINQHQFIDRQPGVLDNIERIFRILSSPVVVTSCVAGVICATTIWYYRCGILKKLNRVEKKQQDLLNQIRSVGEAKKIKDVRNHTNEALKWIRPLQYDSLFPLSSESLGGRFIIHYHYTY